METNTGIARKKQALSGIDPVLLFFLRLYKLQLGAASSAESRLELAPLPEGAPDSDRIYTLRVNHQGVWRSRRMSFGRLGANIANKSLCYRVTFDDLMVVKIPPQPIQEFNDYIECIRRDWRIAEKAGPAIRCVIPSLTALLNRIPFFHHPEVQSPEEVEKRYVFLLRKEPRLQEYLKIDNSFAFFMNLSRNVFLNQEIEQIHDRATILLEDLLKPSDPLWDTHGIDSLHMDESDAAGFEMGQVLAEYETGIADLLDRYDCEPLVSITQRRRWLSAHLSGKTPEAGNTKLPEALMEKLPEYLGGIARRHKKTLEAYRETRRKKEEKIWLERNRGKIKEGISNITQLLVHLKAQRLSIRDLKPENIFIVPDAENADPGKFHQDSSKLGLIDLETALSLDDMENVEQPLCTGTPAYSTPSHLFPNPLLKTMLGDLKRAFSLQDAYAAVGLIYFAATGKVLFEKTGRLLPEMVLAAQKSSLKNRTPKDLFEHASWVFWHSAVAEFTQQRGENAHFFDAVEIPLTRPVRFFLNDMLSETEKHIKDRHFSLLSSQSFLQKAQMQALAAADTEILSRQIRLLESKNAGDTPGREEMLRFFHAFEYLKGLQEEESHCRFLLQDKNTSISVNDLMEIFFFNTLAFMYRESWTGRKHPAFLGSRPLSYPGT